MTDERFAMVEPDAERLEGALERLARGEPIALVVADLRDAPELAALADLGARMVEALPVAASAAMRARHEAALRRTMADLARPSSRPRRAPAPRGVGGWLRGFVLPRPAVALAAVVLACTGLAATGVAALAASSMPGDALYGVKRAVETTRLAMTFDPADRVALRLSFAGERLDEIRALIDRGVMPSPAVIESLIAQYEASLREAAGGGVPASAIEARRAEGAEVLAGLARGASPALRARLDEAIARLGGGAGAAEPPDAAPAPTATGFAGAAGASRAGPTVARPSEAPPGTAPAPASTPAAGEPIAPSGLPAAPTAMATAAAPPAATVAPAGAGGGGSGEPGAPQEPPAAGEPSGDPTSPPAAPTSAIGEQRRQDLTNTPAPPPGGRPGGPPGGHRPRP